MEIKAWWVYPSLISCYSIAAYCYFSILVIMDINPVVQPIVITWQVSSWEAETASISFSYMNNSCGNCFGHLFISIIRYSFPEYLNCNMTVHQLQFSVRNHQCSVSRQQSPCSEFAKRVNCTAYKTTAQIDHMCNDLKQLSALLLSLIMQAGNITSGFMSNMNNLTANK